MSKLALVTSKEMCKIAERRGFQKLRQKGSHATYADNYGNATVIPMHAGDMKRSLIRSIIRDLGLTIDEYEQLRKGC